MCGLVEQCIESICMPGKKIDDPIEFSCQNARLESQQLVEGCHNAAKLAQVINADVSQQTITHKVT